MVRPEGVEPPTYWFVASCSIQLSYGRTLHLRQPFQDITSGAFDQGSRPHNAIQGHTAALSPRTLKWNVGRTGAPGRIRTSDPLVRSQMLYPAELRARGNMCVTLF